MSYRIRNWTEHNAGLKQRGSLTVWLDEAVLSQWNNTEKTGKRGASEGFSDIAIATFETMKSIYGLAGRQTEGFLRSVFELMGLELRVPEHNTVSRRKGRLSVVLPVWSTPCCGGFNRHQGLWRRRMENPTAWSE